MKRLTLSFDYKDNRYELEAKSESDTGIAFRSPVHVASLNFDYYLNDTLIVGYTETEILEMIEFGELKPIGKTT